MPRISELPPATAVNDTDQLETNQTGTSRRVAFSQVQAKLGTVYAPIDSPVFTGEPTAPTPPTGDNSTRVATAAFVKNQNYASLASPALTGNPTAPTPVITDNDTSIATTEFVTRAIGAIPPPVALDPDVISWWTSVNTNGGTASTAQIQAVNTLISSLRAAGAYALMDDLWLLASENQTQAITSLKQRRLGVIVGTPTFSKKGVRFNGSSYIRTGFIPGTHAVSMTGSNMQIGIYLPQTSGASLTSFGTNQGVNQDLYAWPRSGGGQYFYGLNCPAANGGALADSVGLTTCYRNGTTFGGRKNGIDGPLYVPGSNAAVLPTFECYIGARNNSGVADQFCTFTVGLVFTGADITLAREPAVYAAIQAYMVATGALDIYVSSTGLDTNMGSQGSPLLTFGAAYTAAQAGATIWLDGLTATPTTYTWSTGIITKALTVRAVNRRGAALTGVGVVNAAVSINPASGETINLTQIILDPALNASSTKAYGVALLSQAIAYTINLTDCLIRGFTNAGGAAWGISNTSAACKVNLIVTNCDFVGDTCDDGIYLSDFAGGSVNVQGGTITLVNQMRSGHGGIALRGMAAGLAATVNNVVIDTTLLSSIVGAGTHSAVLTSNIPTRITNVTVYLRGTLPPRSGYVLQINTNGAGDATEFPIDGALIDNCTVHSEMSGGGHLFGIGLESYVAATPAKSNNCIISNCTGRVGGTCAPHGAFLGCVTNGKMFNNNLDHPGIVVVNKNSIGSQVYSNVVRSATGTGILCKGATGGAVYDNVITCYANASAGVTFIGVSDDPGGSNIFSSGTTFSRNICTNNGGTTVTWVNVFAGCSGTFQYGSYQQNTGTMHATRAFGWQATNYATFAAWQAAIEPTAAANFP